MTDRRLGPWGEALAADYLRERGYTMIDANYRTRFGELDIVAATAAYVVFVEVKLRANERFGEAREFVDFRKQRRLRSAALSWLSEHRSELQPRFDVIEIYAPYGLETRRPRINHIENAF